MEFSLEFFADYGLFLAKVITFVVAFAVIVAVTAAIAVLVVHVADMSPMCRQHRTYVLILPQTRDMSRHVTSCDGMIRVGAHTSREFVPPV